MKLTSIELRDFRCFGSALFDLTDDGEPLNVALMVGPNGSGKSSVCQAVSGLFSGLHPFGGDQIDPRDVREGSEVAFVEVHWRERGEVPPNLLDFGVRWRQPRNGKREVIPRSQKQYTDWTKSLAEPRKGKGVLVGFDVFRLLPPIQVTGPNIQQVPAYPWQGSLVPTVSRGGGIATRFGTLKQWIVNLDFFRARAKADRNEDLPAWDILRTALDKFLRPWKFEGVDERFDVRFKGPSGSVSLDALSDGLRSVFVIVTELLFRLSLATEHPADALSGEAVCLIDEVDAHLHPEWQESVIPGLCAMFPNVQFIATTHSPYVVASVEPRNVFRIEEET